MKKKLITTLLLTMIIGVVGCGKAEETIEATVETVVEATVEESVEETVVEEITIEEVESTVEETTVEETTEEVVEDPTSESNSTAQILKLLETYDGIMTGNDTLAKMMQDNCETTNGKWDVEVGVFSNGEPPSISNTVVSIGIEYYENCLAGNEPWDVKEWVSQQESDNKVLSMNFDVNADSVDFSTIRLWDAIYSVPYLVNQSSIELKNRTETNEYKFIKGEVSAYTYDLVLNGQEDTGFKAIYDSEGNLLNIAFPEGFELDETMYSFDQNIGTDEEE